MSRLCIALIVASLCAACTSEVDVTEQPDNPADVDPPSDMPPASEYALSNAEQTAFNYFVTKGLTPDAVGRHRRQLDPGVERDPDLRRVRRRSGSRHRAVVGRRSLGHEPQRQRHRVREPAGHVALGAQHAARLHLVRADHVQRLRSRHAASPRRPSPARRSRSWRSSRCAARATRPAAITYANQVLAAYGGSTGGGGGTSGGAGCYSGTLSEQMPENACVQMQVRQPLVPVRERFVGRPLVGSDRVQRRPSAVGIRRYCWSSSLPIATSFASTTVLPRRSRMPPEGSTKSLVVPSKMTPFAACATRLSSIV